MKNILETKKLFVLDMDGTIYLDSTPIQGAKEFIDESLRKGIEVCYFTNNASKSIEMYYEKLKKMNFYAEKGSIMSSADVTIHYLKKNHPGKSIYLVGTPPLEKSFKESGIVLTDGTNADIVVSSFDTTLTYKKLENACRLIRNGAIFYSTHPDYNCPTKDGFIPDSGAICALITASTGVEPRYFGKPHRETAEYISETKNLMFNEIAIFGDRLYTDIKLGRDHNITSVLVLSGETKTEDITSENTADYVYNSLASIW